MISRARMTFSMLPPDRMAQGVSMSGVLISKEKTRSDAKRRIFSRFRKPRLESSGPSYSFRIRFSRTEKERMIPSRLLCHYQSPNGKI